ncbi:MAG: hypothetical protein A2X49_11485 [Lentisphaerae bacterium GWF2_52_8]|nr:MAG: hypothetical protein A2X49_11485 [Lentisphaerae bacterium GWF2_52_8]
MNTKELSDAVKKLALKEGADLVGIAPVSRYEGAPHMLRPQAHLPEAKTVIVMAVHHTDASVEWGGEPNSNYPGPFQIGMIPKLDSIALRVARFIERKGGYATVPLSCTYYWRHRPYKDVPYAHAASFSHMNAFVAAGLGEYGWHGMVMSPKYGPRQRIISVITEAPLLADPLYDGEALCDRCGHCEKACYGMNYHKEHLLSPETMGFSIEGKKFEYANINRWRCFWGEQCHLDMNKLAEVKDLDEQKIYNAMDRGVQTIVRSYAGYMCASFKHCMAKPVRRWDRKYTPGPRRKKTNHETSWDKLRELLISLAKASGADRLSIHPLEKFGDARPCFHKGFRTEDMFREFQWVITIGRKIPRALMEDTPLSQKNRQAALSIMRGQMMIGTVDIARRLDDLGLDAMQSWEGSINRIAASRSAWESPDSLVLESIICKAPLAEYSTFFPRSIDEPDASSISRTLLSKLPHCDLLGAAPMNSLNFPDGEALRKLLPEAQTLLVLGVELPKRVVELAGRQEAECASSYQYVNYQATREAFLAALDIASMLETRGNFAVPLIDLVPSSVGRFAPYIGELSDLRAQAPFAAASGLGALGKSGFLITPEYGPRQRFAFVVTSAAIPASAEQKKGSPCLENCSACADACPLKALKTASGNGLFECDETRCEWARTLGISEGEGSGLLGWKLPEKPMPEEISKTTREAALAQKDPIQVRCYKNPNHSDTQVERCLQACPLAR